MQLQDLKESGVTYLNALSHCSHKALQKNHKYHQAGQLV
jgi:hypothetical protein